MKTKILTLLFCITTVYVRAEALVNQINYEGQDFWVTFMQNNQDPNNDLILSLSFTSREACQVTISNPFTNYIENVYLAANEMQNVVIYTGNVLIQEARNEMNTNGNICYAGYSELIDTCALHITATKNISVVAFNYKRATCDATTVLPTTSLSSEYYIQTYTPSNHAGTEYSEGSHFAIIAADDSVVVDYCPMAPTATIKEAKATYELSGGVGMTDEEIALAQFQLGDTLHSPILMKGHVWYVWTGKEDGVEGDLSGTYVKARGGKKIAIFQGCPMTNVPYQIKERDHLFSQAIPLQYWGRTFVLTTSKNRNVDIMRIMAYNDATEVYINGLLVHTFDFSQDKNHYWEFKIGAQGDYANNGSCIVTTSDICAIYMYLASKKTDNTNNGDPAMLYVNPIEQQCDISTFVTCPSNNGNSTPQHYVNIVTEEPSKMYLDNSSINYQFKSVEGSSLDKAYYYAQINLGSEVKSHTLQSYGGNFIAHVYGFNSNESYGYSIGGLKKYFITDGSNKTHGYVNNTGPFEYLGQYVITAVPNYGYHFTQWSDGVTKNPRTIELKCDTTFTAYFAADKSGTCGDELALKWEYDDKNKSLTISGYGTLNSNYTFGVEAPKSVEKLIIDEGVTTIGNSVFANYSTIKHISIPTTVKTIYEQAFYNCTGLEQIFSYRDKPSNAYSNTFDGIDKSECTLHVLSASVDLYSKATGWRDFYYIETIDAEEITEPVEDVIVTPTNTTAGIIWPYIAGAVTYEIVIRNLLGKVICQLTFNASGHLIGIAFAPSRNNQSQSEQTTGFQFTVTGLNSGTTYTYSVEAKDESDQTIETKSGTFTTTSEVPTGVDQVQSDQVHCTKLIKEGQIFILRGDKTYTLQGQEVK